MSSMRMLRGGAAVAGVLHAGCIMYGGGAGWRDDFSRDHLLLQRGRIPMSRRFAGQQNQPGLSAGSGLAFERCHAAS
eukprot:6984243-Prymnesium_polylepis.1